MDLETLTFSRCMDCGQGQFEMVKDTKFNKFLVVCDECHALWPDPESALTGENYIPRGHKYCNLIDATLDEIKEIGWEKYLLL